jgi:hypothetical protein
LFAKEGREEKKKNAGPFFTHAHKGSESLFAVNARPSPPLPLASYDCSEPLPRVAITKRFFFFLTIFLVPLCNATAKTLVELEEENSKEEQKGKEKYY